MRVDDTSHLVVLRRGPATSLRTTRGSGGRRVRVGWAAVGWVAAEAAVWLWRSRVEPAVVPGGTGLGRQCGRSGPALSRALSRQCDPGGAGPSWRRGRGGCVGLAQPRGGCGTRVDNVVFAA
jgi:hypothetical protein